MNLHDLGNMIQAEKGKKQLLQDQIEENKITKKEKERYSKSLKRARELVAEVSSALQLQVKEELEIVVTKAIQSVYDFPYEFVVDLEVKRNKSEARLLVKDGEREPFVPKDDKGCGMIDVISLALRLVMRALEEPQSRNILILDEPGKWTGVLINEFGQMLREISQSLGTQIIMVTHDQELIDHSDKCWKVHQNRRPLLHRSK